MWSAANSPLPRSIQGAVPASVLPKRSQACTSKAVPDGEVISGNTPIGRAPQDAKRSAKAPHRRGPAGTAAGRREERRGGCGCAECRALGNRPVALTHALAHARLGAAQEPRGALLCFRSSPPALPCSPTLTCTLGATGRCGDCAASPPENPVKQRERITTLSHSPAASPTTKPRLASHAEAPQRGGAHSRSRMRRGPLLPGDATTLVRRACSTARLGASPSRRRAGRWRSARRLAHARAPRAVEEQPESQVQATPSESRVLKDERAVISIACFEGVLYAVDHSFHTAHRGVFLVTHFCSVLVFARSRGPRASPDETPPRTYTGSGVSPQTPKTKKKTSALTKSKTTKMQEHQKVSICAQDCVQ